VVGAVCLLIILPPIGLTALAWNGAMALGVWAVFCGLRARRSASPGRWALASGLLVGLALLFRPDLFLACALSSVAVLWGAGAHRLRRFAVGVGLGLAPYLVQLATAGVTTTVRGIILDPVFHLRGGRSLPIPPDPSQLTGFLQLSGETYLLHWPLPTPTTAQQVFLWFWLVFLANAVLLGVAVWRFRRDRSFPARVLLAVALFSLGMLPQGVQRTDSTHFAWATAVGIGFLPVALFEVVRVWAPRRRRGFQAAVAGLVVLVLLLAVIPTFTYRRYTDLALQTFGVHRLSFEVERNGRSYFYGRPDAAHALEDLLPDIEAASSPGDRLFVGTGDLRKTPYSDAFLYYLFPELPPATHYIELDPGVANRRDSGLSEDLASADIVVLSRIWDDWDEPNDSRVFGSDEPNQVLRRRFHRVGVYGDRYDLYELWLPGRA